MAPAGPKGTWRLDTLRLKDPNVNNEPPLVTVAAAEPPRPLTPDEELELRVRLRAVALQKLRRGDLLDLSPASAPLSTSPNAAADAAQGKRRAVGGEYADLLDPVTLPSLERLVDVLNKLPSVAPSECARARLRALSTQRG